MHNLMKAGLGLFGAALLVAAGAAGALVWAGQQSLDKDHGALPETLAGGSGDAVLGARLARVYGCSGCHGAALTGADFYGIVAPNLRRRARAWRPEDFARAVRKGLRPDGTSISWAMPSEMFAAMADNEIAAIYAHLRTLPAARDAQPVTLKHRLFKAWAAATGELIPNVVLVRATDAGPTVAPAPGTPQWGPYFTRQACAECHNHGLGGNGGQTPALADVIQIYDWLAFERLTTTGVPLDGRKLRLMGGVGAKRLSHMTAAERRALFDYLKGLPQP
ncbi:cytochrome c [Sandarakinorhabdus sp. AAP62]|uniref:c-type cytochrome n=1 Tax=Sandarakinorhabdus sp. AAP62 TaxID=1248916 RepID=UPI000314E9C4|nr:cytochrome c [Sandarakinorhabdus sp. AAP62]